jgi:hypothetical protein
MLEKISQSKKSKLWSMPLAIGILAIIPLLSVYVLPHPLLPNEDTFICNWIIATTGTTGKAVWVLLGVMFTLIAITQRFRGKYSGKQCIQLIVSVFIMYGIVISGEPLSQATEAGRNLCVSP